MCVNLEFYARLARIGTGCERSCGGSKRAGWIFTIRSDGVCGECEERCGERGKG